MDTTTPSLWLCLQAHDAPALIDWYVDVLGLRVTARFGDGDRVDHAELRWPEGAGGLMIGSHDASRDYSIPPGSGHAYVVTADPDAVHARVVAAGGEVLRGPADVGHGREVSVRDPEGNSWSFGTYPGAA